MGQNFGTILIERIDINNENEVTQVLSKINEQFKKEKEGLTYNEFLNEKWNRNSEGLIGFFNNENIIIIEDEYDLIKNSFLKETSEILNTVIVKATNSDTVGLSMIQIYENGELIRMKSYGLENDIDYLSEVEKKSIKGIGEPTKYETNGSDATNVFQSFIEGKVQASEINEMTIFKKK